MKHLAQTICITLGTVFMFFVGVASAHIQAFPVFNADHSQAAVTFTIPHGCDDSPTTKIEMQFPKEVLSVTPISDQTWLASGGSKQAASMGHGSHKMMDDTAMGGEEESDASGEGTVVVWSSKKGVPAESLGTLQAVVVLPANFDETIWLPTVQTCKNGEANTWTTREAGSETPAPHMMADSSGMMNHEAAMSNTDKYDSDDRKASKQADTASDHEPSERVLAIALILGGLGMIFGVAGFVRSRRN